MKLAGKVALITGGDSSPCRCVNSSIRTRSAACHNARSSSATNFGSSVSKSVALFSMAFMAQSVLHGFYKMQSESHPRVFPVPNVPRLPNGHRVFRFVAGSSDQFQVRFCSDK